MSDSGIEVAPQLDGTVVITPGESQVPMDLMDRLLDADVTALVFTVPGCPVPWARSRHNGKQHFKPPRMRAQQERIAYAFQAGVHGWNPDGMFAVEYEFVMPDWRVVDLDNLKKLTNDALNKLAWVDDHRIVRAFGCKTVSVGSEGMTRITITRIGDWPVKQRARKA